MAIDPSVQFQFDKSLGEVFTSRGINGTPEYSFNDVGVANVFTFMCTHGQNSVSSVREFDTTDEAILHCVRDLKTEIFRKCTACRDEFADPLERLAKRY